MKTSANYDGGIYGKHSFHTDRVSRGECDS